MTLTEPTLLLDESKCRRNIKKMALKVKNQGIHLRPHFKTHQSLEIGRWFKEVGVDRITVSSLRMAEYFSKEWKDITVAFPVNILELDRIQRLAAKVQLNLLVESKDAAQFLADKLKYEVGIFLKIDAGYHRTGMDVHHVAYIQDLLSLVSRAEKLELKGLLAHSGHSYSSSSPDEVREIHQTAVDALNALKNALGAPYSDLIISLGDTPCCSIVEDFGAVDELRPGNFVFYDLMQHYIGSNSTDEIAVALACPVVALHPDRQELVLYGGGVHFSKDFLSHPTYGTMYGQVVKTNGLTWGPPIPGMYVKKLSQEHGIVHVPTEELDQWQVGDIMYVLPVHSCMTANLMKGYLSDKGRYISMLS